MQYFAVRRFWLLRAAHLSNVPLCSCSFANETTLRPWFPRMNSCVFECLAVITGCVKRIMECQRARLPTEPQSVTTLPSHPLRRLELQSGKSEHGQTTPKEIHNEVGTTLQ
eukprot:588377-Amphidinium_carterae.1